jgi:hypothetical protein
VRNQKATAFYQSQEWEVVRIHVLNLYNGIDLYAYYIDKKNLRRKKRKKRTLWKEVQMCCDHF